MTTPSLSLTLSRVKQVLSYDPLTGIFRWKVRTSNRVKVGDVAGTSHSQGYITIKLDGELYLAHRLAWFIYYGAWPLSKLDHKDTIRTHNWIDNLRLATAEQNCMNSTIRSSSKTGYKGVSKRRNGFRAVITFQGKQIHLGDFKTATLAAEAYTSATKKYFGEFARYD